MMDVDRFYELRNPGAILWKDAIVIREKILEYKPKTVLELGVFQGLGTLVIMDALEEVGQEHEFISVDNKACGQKIAANSERLRGEHIPPGSPVTQLTSDAVRYLKTLKDGSVDMIIEDTTHRTDYTMALIPVILRVLTKPGGVALFHDLQLESMQEAFKRLRMYDDLELFPPSWMGLLKVPERFM